MQQVKANNIIEQVANKIQINVGDEGSEMTLQLKPENLGKLDMKISIERGIVVARFVAESQMVKEVIESNFNTLKDALQEKGLAVQELSVFVGNDPNYQNQQNFMTFKRKASKGNNGYDEGIFGGSVEEVAANHSRSLSTSKIDFFA
nr:flagellar hook-length control protein FliK [Anaerosolibacter carboniphilus]